MPTGMPREWTLEELQTIWEFDGDEGQTTVNDAARGMGISHSYWYGMRSRLHDAGGAEALFEKMQNDKQRRYNRASNGRVRVGKKQPDTVAEAVTRQYVIRVSGAGRDGQYEQFSVTIPPILARAFIAANEGRMEVLWEPTETGLLLKTAPPPPVPELPSWLTAQEDAGAAV